MIGWPCVAAPSIRLWQAALALTTLGARHRLRELPRTTCDAEIDRFRWSIFFRYLSASHHSVVRREDLRGEFIKHPQA